ncbi:helix-turn-helix transcriptional regulator [Clostridium sp.]|uniref:helix-turn-helix transcriptional regulator n=1 Tax=Clostridium sp. TaxID=1506 RepID=UPI002FCCA1F3
MKKEMAIKLGSAIKEARKKAKYTQKDVSDKTEISRNYISDIECGRYTPSVDKLIKISNLLDLDLNLIKNDGNTRM